MGDMVLTFPMILQAGLISIPTAPRAQSTYS